MDVNSEQVEGRDALAFLDPSDKSLSVYAGKDADGKIKTRPANSKPEEFVKVDNPNMIDNLISEYKRQSQNPQGLRIV